MNILMVDDNPKIIQSMELYNYEWNWDFDFSGNGQEAVQMAAQKEYDVMLMDIDMPVMNGLEATKAIRLNEQFSYTPILCISGDDTMKECALKSGMDDFIGKPFERNELRDKLLVFSAKIGKLFKNEMGELIIMDRKPISKDEMKKAAEYKEKGLELLEISGSGQTRHFLATANAQNAISQKLIGQGEDAFEIYNHETGFIQLIYKSSLGMTGRLATPEEADQMIEREKQEFKAKTPAFKKQKEK